MTRARPRKGFRFAAATLVLVFTIGQLASFAHLVLVQHRRCAEHGELIDVHPDRPNPAASMEVVGTGPQLVQASMAGTDHRHDHCAAAPQRREKSAPAPLGIGHMLQQTATARLSHPQHAITLTVLPLYRLAPKTSPPA